MRIEGRKLCKVFVEQGGDDTPRERLWAEMVGEDTGRIVNIPFFTDEVAYQDLVRISEDGEVLEVLQRTTRTRRATYPAASKREDAVSQYQAICDYLRPFQIECESFHGGTFCMAVPSEMTDDRIRALCAHCPVSLTIDWPDPASE